MGYPQMPQYGPGGGMPVRPVSGMTHTMAGVIGALFALSPVAYMIETVGHLDLMPGGQIIAFLVLIVSGLVGIAGVVLLMTKVRVGIFVLPGAVALFYVGWVLLVLTSGAPGAMIKASFSSEGWKVGIATGLFFGFAAAVLTLLPTTKAYIDMFHGMKDQRPAQPPYQPMGPQGYPAQMQPGPHGYAPPMGQPPMGQPPMGQPQQYPGQPPQHPGQPRQW